MNTGKRLNRNPLREVVGIAHVHGGLYLESLECGHRQAPPRKYRVAEQLPNGTWQPKQRRCYRCGVDVGTEPTLVGDGLRNRDWEVSA